MNKDNVALIHNGIQFSHKKDETPLIATTGLEIIVLIEASLVQKDKYHTI
jgi:hypothetical protein